MDHAAKLMIGSKAWAKYLYGFIIVAWIVYVLLTYSSSSADVSESLHISTTFINLLRITLVVPFLFIWLSAAYSYVRIKTYADTIAGSKESHGFKLIAKGLLALLIGLLSATLFSAIDNFTDINSTAHKAFTIFNNYIYIVTYLIAFVALWRGAQDLRQRLRWNIPMRLLIRYGIILGLFMFVWLDLIFTNASRTTPIGAQQSATYYLRDSLIVLTIVLPSVFAWIAGIAAALELRQYGEKVKGVLYRRALVSLVRGTWMVVVASILLQAVLSLGTNRLLEAGLGGVLAIIYAFLLLQGLGFYFMARGANNLTKLEVV